MTRRRAGLALLAALVGLAAAACGVEVPDDVAADIRSSTTTTLAEPTTTALPTSDDELEQALIDNGYSLAEAECGAENLREALAEDEVRSIVEADTIEDISADTAREFAAALRPCVEDGAPSSGGGGGGGDDDDEDGGGGGGGMPGFGDDSSGEVSRSRFLAALISAGVPDDEARCIVERAFDELDQDELDDLFHAESPEDLPADLVDAFQAITDDCAA